MTERFPPSVSLQGVSRAFGRSFALHRVNLTLSSGTITAIVGNNGAGKSTLLNLLATVDQPTAGEIRYGEHSARSFARRGRHRIGWVSHQTQLYEELTGRENLHFFATMYGLDDVPSRASAWLERVGLADNSVDRPVRTYSRGMKQRLTLARALISNPQLLLLDEPATGLDQQASQLLRELLDDLRQRQRIIILVTHNFDLIDDLADRIVILRRGKIALERSLDDIPDLMQAYRSHA